MRFNQNQTTKIETGEDHFWVGGILARFIFTKIARTR